MALPDKYENEPTAEIPAALWAAYAAARTNAEGWRQEEKRYREQIEKALGTFPAGTVGGVKVVTYRPDARYAEARLQAENPDLARHYVTGKMVDVFNMSEFAKHHPDIAEKYRSRSFRVSE